MKPATLQPPSEGFLSRWSRLKRESAPDPATADGMPSSAEITERADSSIAAATSPASSTMARSSANQPPAPTSAAPPLPAIDTLTFDSDYAAFFQPQVPDDLRRAAVKKLFADPHFNVMDGLDVYIDDYSKPDPLPEGWLEKIAHARDLIDHPSNRKPAEEGALVEADTTVEVDSAASPEPQVDDLSANGDATAHSNSVENGDATAAVDAIEKDDILAAVDAVENDHILADVSAIAHASDAASASLPIGPHPLDPDPPAKARAPIGRSDATPES